MYHFVLIPINVYNAPEMTKYAPATDNAGVIAGLIGSSFGPKTVVPKYFSILGVHDPNIHVPFDALLELAV